MNLLFVAVRTIHLAAAILSFGALAFALAVARPSCPSSEGAVGAVESERWLLLIALASAIIGAVASTGWLALEAAAISGLPLPRALHAEVLGPLLSRTTFGRVWLLRGALVLVLVAVLAVALRAPAPGGRRTTLAAATALAGAFLGAIAWAGHAAAGQGVDGAAQLGADVVHLLAAGAWVGALPALAMMVARAPSPDVAARAARRFSTLGVVGVGALLVTGIVNAWYLVGDIPALVGTAYGRWLLAKLALFALMLALAVVNRYRLTPRMAANDRARQALARNAMLEAIGGLAVVIVVGVLGIAVPAKHEAPEWPFAYTLRWPHGDDRGFVVPAYPTTYMRPAVPYDVVAIARGAALYAEHCRGCHGDDARGNGPLAGALPVAPPDLPVHAVHHRPGDLFWWISRGRPGTPMPAFSPPLAADDVWSVIRFLEWQSDLRLGAKLTDRVDPWLGIVAPDFTYETSGQQHALRDADRHVATLVVLYSLPASALRLRELAADAPALEREGVRVVAVPLERASAGSEDAAVPGLALAAAPDAALAYAAFAARAQHAELLIDRQGYLRARWVGAPDEDARRTAVADLAALRSERPHPPPSGRHAH